MARPAHRIPTLDGSLGTPVYEPSEACSMKSAPEVGIAVQLKLTPEQLHTIYKASTYTAVTIQQSWTKSGGLHTYIKTANGNSIHVSRDGRLSEELEDPS